MNQKLYLLFILLISISCSPKLNVGQITDDGLIEVVFLHVNDVYEIAPMPGDDKGGMARVATLKKQLLAQNKNTLAILPGDFLSPSVIGTLDDSKGNGIKGAQMIDVMNASGIDIVTFGNHEFDLKEDDIQNRIDESTFQWVSSNVLHVKNGKQSAFAKNKNELRNEKQIIPETLVKKFTDEDGTSITVGFFGVTLDVKKQPFVEYQDPFQRSKEMVIILEKEVDIILPITHLEIQDDLKLARMFPQFPLVMGGHDHNNMKIREGNTIVAKADANAKTAYVHTIKFNVKNNTHTVTSKLVTIDSTIPSDAVVNGRVKYWKDLAWDDLNKKGFNPNETVVILKKDLDGREGTIRGGQCPLGKVVAESIVNASKGKIDGAFFNSGSIRIDDILSGNLTQYDIIRILPYKSSIIEVEMTGTLLKKILESSVQNRGEGSYLQLSGFKIDESTLIIKHKGKILKTDRNYTVAMNDFLLAGYDFEFLTKNTEGIIKINAPDENDADDLRNDLRKALIDYLRKKD